MKKIIFAVFTAVLLSVICMNICVFAADNRRLLICDGANEFTENQKAALYERFDKTALIANCALVIYTSADTEIMLADAAAELETQYPSVTEGGYVMLYINTAKGDVLAAASGENALEEFSERDLESLAELAKLMQSTSNTYEAADWFIVFCTPDSTKSEEKWEPAIPDYTETKPAKRKPPVKLDISPLTAVISAAVLSVIFGIIAMLITAKLLRRELKSIESRHGASYYIEPGESKFEVAYCGFLYEESVPLALSIILNIPKNIKKLINKIKNI